MMKIKDLNIGELDARFEDINNFNDDYIILPDQISYEEIVSNRNLYYLIGNKGTGKTALLLYLSNKLKSEYPQSVCSTILFKTKFDSIEKNRLQSINNQIFQTIEIDSTELMSIDDFKNIWKLEIYFKIVFDNHKCNYTIFERDTNWNAFEEMVLRLTNTLNIDVEEKLYLFNKIPKTIVFNQNENTLSVSKEQVTYPNDVDSISLNQFNQAIKILDCIFATLTREKSPYFICIDELETSFSSTTFKRDIHMIHDWIEIVWSINEKIRQNNYENMKLILSVRSEILNAISQTLFGDEINKKTGSFGRLIEWRSKSSLVNTPIKNLYTPVIQIMLKKIMISCKEDPSVKSEDIYNQWFEKEIAGEDTTTFIYERTWGKPRDAVRFLSVAKQFCDNKDRFDRQLLIDMQNLYSSESKKEIYEEMSACYSQSIVTALFESLDGYKSSFSLEEYKTEAKLSTFLNDKFNSSLDILKLLFNFGIVGCRNEKTEVNRWAYNGDQFVEGRGWRFIVHPGLKMALNLEETEVNGIYIYDAIGTCVECKIESINKSHIFVSFEYNSIKCNGNIHISKIKKDAFLTEIPNEFHTLKLIRAYIIGYDNYYQKWELSCFTSNRVKYREE